MARFPWTTALFLALHVAAIYCRDFDYFVFVRQWPGSSCHAGSCPLLQVNDFTIHGLWPNYNDGTYPQFCDDSSKFIEDDVLDLLPYMKADWPSYYASNEDFWTHEWTKHGTCATSVLPTEHTFFETIINLHVKYNVTTALAASSISPSATPVKQEHITGALQSAWNVKTLAHCLPQHDGPGLLSEVWICLDKSLRPMDCPAEAGRSSCQEVVMKPLQLRTSLLLHLPDTCWPITALLLGAVLAALLAVLGLVMRLRRSSLARDQVQACDQKQPLLA